MSAAAVSATCCCGSLLPAVVLCPDHHRYFRSGKELDSVSRVIRTAWPVKKNFEDADPAVLENARDRGIETDWLFSEWLAGRLTVIPPNTRTDARDRFFALVRWWDTRGFPEIVDVEPQLTLANNETAGTADVVMSIQRKGARIMDLKNVAAIDPSYHLQLGAYADLYEDQYGVEPEGIGIIHVTQPKDKPVSVRYVEIDMPQARSDWRVLKAVYDVVKRRVK